MQLQPGDECYHKATGLSCVVIETVDEKRVKVTTSEDQERIYYVLELRKDDGDSGIGGSDNGEPMFTKGMEF